MVYLLGASRLSINHLESVARVLGVRNSKAEPKKIASCGSTFQLQLKPSKLLASGSFNFSVQLKPSNLITKVHTPLFQDERFNHDIDQQTGYKTRSLLCMPIKDINGEVIGVAQVGLAD